MREKGKKMEQQSGKEKEAQMSEKEIRQGVNRREFLKDAAVGAEGEDLGAHVRQFDHAARGREQLAGRRDIGVGGEAAHGVLNAEERHLLLHVRRTPSVQKEESGAESAG